MRKLKKQAEDAKQRKTLAKKEKGWVGGSTIPREVVLPVATKISPKAAAAAGKSNGTVMIDTTGKANSSNRQHISSFNFEELD